MYLHGIQIRCAVFLNEVAGEFRFFISLVRMNNGIMAFSVQCLGDAPL